MVLGLRPPAMPNGHVLKEHAEKMRDLLSEGFGDPNHEYKQAVTYTMQQWIQVIEFLQDMFKDNRYWSKLVAKAHASILAVADNLPQDKQIQDSVTPNTRATTASAALPL